jgi:probable rRNA maturation factor
MEVLFQIDEAFLKEIDTGPLETALLTTLRRFGEAEIEEASLTLSVMDSETVQQLNAQYLGIEAPTDVLSFENMPDPDFPEVDPEAAHYLGDVVIAYPVAQSQAEAGGHSALAEVTLLAVHGTLHLLGFDHDTPEHKAAMWSAQAQVMADLGLAHVQPTED